MEHTLVEAILARFPQAPGAFSSALFAKRNRGIVTATEENLVLVMNACPTLSASSSLGVSIAYLTVTCVAVEHFDASTEKHPTIGTVRDVLVALGTFLVASRAQARKRTSTVDRTNATVDSPAALANRCTSTTNILRARVTF